MSLNVFPLSWATWCMTCNWHTSFSSFWLSSFSSCVSLSSLKHFTWSTKSPRYSARPTSCAMSLLLVRFFSSSGDWMYKKRNNYFLPLFRYGMKVEAFIPEAMCNLSLLPLLPKNRQKWVSTFVIHFFKSTSTCSAILLSVRSYEPGNQNEEFSISLFSQNFNIKSTENINSLSYFCYCFTWRSLVFSVNKNNSNFSLASGVLRKLGAPKKEVCLCC